MAGELTPGELSCAAVRAPDRRGEARWLTRAFLEARFHHQAGPQVDACVRLTRIARAARDPLVGFPARAVDGILSADAGSPRTAARLGRAVSMFDPGFDVVPQARSEPLWVELMGHVLIALGQERRVHRLVADLLAPGSPSAGERQRLECLLAAAQLDSGHVVQAAAALTEAALPTGLVDPLRSRWAVQTLRGLSADAPDARTLTSEELRMLAAMEEGLTDAQAAHRLGMSTRSVRFCRRVVQGKLAARHRSA